MQKQYQVLFYFQQKKNTSIWNKTPAFASWEQKWKFSETGACSEFQSFKIVRKKTFWAQNKLCWKNFRAETFFQFLFLAENCQNFSWKQKQISF